MMLACAAAAEPKPEQARDLWIEMQETYARAGAGLDPQTGEAMDEGDGEDGGNGGVGKIQPGVREYTAFMRALGSTKATYLEAFEVMRQMLARHEEASYTPFTHSETDGQDGAFDRGDAGAGADRGDQFRFTKWTPTKDTWKALLEGTKRAGDVERSKWVLLEAAHWAEKTGEEMMDEDMVASVLMAYAAFVPKRTRVGVVVRGGEAGREERGEGEGEGEEVQGAELSGKGLASEASLEVGAHGQGQGQGQNGAEAQLDDAVGNGEQRVTHRRSDEAAPLQATLTAAQAIAEARSVFDLVRSRSQPPPPLHSSTSQASPDSDDHSAALTRPHTDTSFRITTRLVNSFLSVIYAHAPSIDACRTEWKDIWMSFSGGTNGGKTRARPNGWSYLHALERCAVGQRHLSHASSSDAGAERKAALAWAEELWAEYTSAFPPVSTTPSSSTSTDTHTDINTGIGPRQIERAWTSIIRSHALSNSLPTALSLLLAFSRLYPPSTLVDTALLDPSTGTSHPSFKIRFSDPTTVLDTDTPPHLLWQDVDVLHQRLVRDGDAKGVGKVKMVTMGYLRALRERRAVRRREGRERGRGRGRKGREVGEGRVSGVEGESQ